MSEKDGGSAFPRRFGEGDMAGMTLRDYFAGQALAGTSMFNGIGTNDAAEQAYRLADAMLKARKT